MEKFLYRLFSNLPRYGPGSRETTRKAYSYIKVVPEHPKILDVGCGTGVSTIELARLSEGEIHAIDTGTEYLEVLNEKLKKLRLQERVSTYLQSMDQLEFEKKSFDLIWSEGALYNMGFKRGLTYMKQFLKPKGYLAVSELTWFRDNPPEELLEYWKEEYPLMKNGKENKEIIESSGFELIGSFQQPKSDWIKEYYDPLSERINILREQQGNDDDFMNFLDWNQKEIDIYHKYSDFYGYEFYIMLNNPN